MVPLSFTLYLLLTFPLRQNKYEVFPKSFRVYFADNLLTPRRTIRERDGRTFIIEAYVHITKIHDAVS